MISLSVFIELLRNSLTMLVSNWMKSYFRSSRCFGERFHLSPTVTYLCSAIVNIRVNLSGMDCTGEVRHNDKLLIWRFSELTVCTIGSIIRTWRGSVQMLPYLTES